MDLKARARELLSDWRGETYAFGLGVLDKTGALTARLGSKALLVANDSGWLAPAVAEIERSVAAAGVEIAAHTRGSRPNSPTEDVYRIQEAIEAAQPEVIIAAGGGSTIDATKASTVLAQLSPGVHDVSAWFGVGRVTEALGSKALIPLLAVETASSSGAHLTKYSNITDLAAGQKKLIIDEKIVPPAAVFDYAVTASASRGLTCDGAFDGLSHCLEVYLGAKGPILEKVEEICLAGIELVVTGVKTALDDPADLRARETLGLGTDLGGHAIMVGSTNGAHLTSFSLVDVTTHGRATAILNPYYTVLFAEAIERQLQKLAEVYRRAGLLATDVSRLSGRELGLAAAEAMQSLPKSLGFPTSLGELSGFKPAHTNRAVAAAKDHQLASKLQAMPIPMDAAMVDRYMRPTLEAAAAGDLAKVPVLSV